MAYVAAAALGLAGGLVPFARPGLRNGWQYEPVIGSVWLALSLSLATLAAGLRRPRPALSRLARRPGFVACLSAAVTLLVAVVSQAEGLIGALADGGWPVDRSRLFWSVGTNVNMNTRYAIAAAWAAQGLAGRWRPEPCWTDRLGLSLGGYWLAAPALIQCRRVLEALW